MFAHDTVPIRCILRVEDCLDMLGNILLCVFSVHDIIHLLLELALHFLVHLTDDIVDDSISAHIYCVFS